MRLSAEVVDLVRPYRLEDPVQGGRVVEVPVDQVESLVLFPRRLIQMIDSPRGNGRRTADHTPDLVAFREQEFREVRAVLAGDSGDQRTAADQVRPRRREIRFTLHASPPLADAVAVGLASMHPPHT